MLLGLMLDRAGLYCTRACASSALHNSSQRNAWCGKKDPVSDPVQVCSCCIGSARTSRYAIANSSGKTLQERFMR